MVAWQVFSEESPRIADVFVRRHTATGKLCLLATLRSDGYPRISPMEPTLLEGDLLLVGMPNTAKFRDLGRDPRFCLHTATVDPYVGDGDAKLWGVANNVQDKACMNDSPPGCSRTAGPTCEGNSSIPSTSRTSPAPPASRSSMAG